MKRYMGQDPKQRSFCPRGVSGPVRWHVEAFWFPTWKLSEKGPQSCPLGFLWRLHHIVMIDEVIGQWQLVQPQVPSPCPEIRGWDWKFQPSDHMVGAPGNQPPALKWGTEDKSPNIIPLFLAFRNFQGLWGLWARNCGCILVIKWPNRYFSCKLQYSTPTFWIWVREVDFAS